MKKEYEKDGEENQSFLALLDWVALRQFDQLLFRLEQLQHLCKTEHSNEFVKLANPRETHHHRRLLLVLIRHQKKIHG